MMATVGWSVCGWVCVCVQLCLHTVDMQEHESGSNKPGVEMSRAGAKNAWMGKRADYCSTLWYSCYL